MKKNLVKKFAALSLAATLICSMTACGSSGKETAALNGFYSSTQSVGFFSAFPEYTFKQATFGLETIETYADGTYCLTSTDSNFSGALTFADDGSHEEVPRGANVIKYYGTFRASEEQGLLTLTLSSPVSVAVASTYSVGESVLGYLDTSAWTEEMGKLAGGEGGTMTAEEYLNSVSWPETAVIVDTATDSFDYVVLSADK